MAVNKPNNQSGKDHSKGSNARRHERPHPANQQRFESQKCPPAPTTQRRSDKRQR